MCNVAVPEFFTETFRDALVPGVTAPKSRLPGTIVTAGAGVRPAPLICADSVGGEALLGMCTAGGRRPVAEGGKDTSTERELTCCRTVVAWMVSPIMSRRPE